MAVATEDWSRPGFEPGGGDAAVFYLAFGALADVRLPPIPVGLSLGVHPQGEARLWVEPLVAASQDADEERPVSPGLVRSAPDFAVLRGRRIDPPDLTHLRDAEAVIAALLDAGAAAVLDVEARRWWAPERFRREVLAGFRPAVRAHVSVRTRRGMVETRGLRKFGRPDLRLHRVPPAEEREALGVCWGLVERLARGARPGPGLSAGDLRLEPSGEPDHPALEGDRARAGTPAELLAAVRDPWAIAAAARAAGAQAPETRSIDEPPVTRRPGSRTASVWLRKPRHGGGGRGVRRWMGGRLRTSEILQRHVRGLSCSAVAIADGRRAMVLGVTEQLHRAPGFGWTGNLTPPRLPDVEQAELDGQLRAVCAEVAERFGVRGAFGVDAVWDGRHAWVLEVNPRPPAGLELFGPASFEAHVRGARGLGLPVPGKPPATRCAKVKLVLFAPHDLRAPDPCWWPAGLVRDIPHAGETIRRGDPVCTLISATESAPAIATLGARLLAALPEAVLAHD